MALTLALLLPAPLTADPVRSMAPMAEVFFSMMEEMAHAYTRHRQDQKGAYRWEEPPPPPPLPLPLPSLPGELPQPSLHFDFPALPSSLSRLLPSAPSAPPPTTRLDGWWVGQSGEVLAFRGNRFRIYIGPYDYREGQVKVSGWQVVLSDPESGVERHYDFALEREYLALRDASGTILYYIRAE